MGGWDRIETTTDVSGRLAVDGAELARFAQELAESADHGEGRVVAARVFVEIPKAS